MSDGMSDARNYGPSLSKHGPPIVSKHGKPVNEDCCEPMREAVETFQKHGVNMKEEELRTQVEDAMKACPWATHARDHTEPKHCIAALASLINLREKEKAREDPILERIDAQLEAIREMLTKKEEK